MIFLSDKSRRVNLKIDAELQESIISISQKMNVSQDEAINAGLSALNGREWMKIIRNYKINKLASHDKQKTRYLSLVQIESELMGSKREIDNELVHTLHIG
jgi:hypothetical protein